MTVEISFPLEFVVPGVPVSLQAKRAESREAWKARVKEASLPALPEGHFAVAVPLAVTLFYFPAGEMARDIDNIVKPVLDALRKHIYLNDRQVERVWVQKLAADTTFRFSRPSKVLEGALQGRRPLLYIRITDDPMEGLS